MFDVRVILPAFMPALVATPPLVVMQPTFSAPLVVMSTLPPAWLVSPVVLMVALLLLIVLTTKVVCPMETDLAFRSAFR